MKVGAVYEDLPENTNFARTGTAATLDGPE